MKIIGVNGMTPISGWIRTGRPNNGEGSTDLMLEQLRLRGHEVYDFGYDPVTILRARSLKLRQQIGRRIAAVADRGDCLLAHSMGCLFGGWSMKLGAQYRVAFLIAPAMSRYWTFPANGARYIWILSSSNDLAIRVGECLLAHPFGAMGRRGYATADDSRIVQIRTTLGHMDYFKRGQVEFWSEFIHKRIQFPAEYAAQDRAEFDQTKIVEVLE